MWTAAWSEERRKQRGGLFGPRCWASATHAARPQPTSVAAAGALIGLCPDSSLLIGPAKCSSPPLRARAEPLASKVGSAAERGSQGRPGSDRRAPPTPPPFSGRLLSPCGGTGVAGCLRSPARCSVLMGGRLSPHSYFEHKVGWGIATASAGHWGYPGGGTTL